MNGRVRNLLVVGCLAVAAWLLLPGWVQYKTDRTPACAVRWYAASGQATAPVTVPLQVDQGGLDGISSAQLVDIASKSSSAWSTVTCPPTSANGKPVPATLQVQGASAPTAIGGECIIDASGACVGQKSNGNFVRAVRTGQDWPYGSTVFALTVLTHNTCTGEIVDADVLLDDAHHDFCVGTCKPGQQDVCNTVTHELGHLLGLDHSAVFDATMFASAPSGETSKCSLDMDDRTGVCAVYTNGCGATHSCSAATGSTADPGTGAGDSDGCAASPTADGGVAPILMIFSIFLIFWRRRRCAST